MKKVLYLIFFTILIFGAFFGYKKITAKEEKHTEYKIVVGDIVQRVIVNGKTKAATSVNLGFEVSGKVASTSVKVGSHVEKGDVLVYLDDSELKAEVMRAKAIVAADQAILENLRKGATFEQVSVSETELSNAESALSDAEKSLEDKVRDIISNTVDNLYSNPHTSTPQFNLPLADSQLKDSLGTDRVHIELLLSQWSKDRIDDSLQQVTSFIEKIAKAVNSQTPSANYPETTLATYRSSLSSARSTLISAKSSLTDARSSLALAKKKLILVKSGNTPEVIKAQVARVVQDQGQLQSIYSEMNKMVLKSPQTGLVTTQDAKVGQIVNPGRTLVTVISDSNMEIEGYVSEINIAKVKIGDPVSISFDAFPDNEYAGTVTYIEPSEVLIDGVVNYKVSIAFEKVYSELKSGLTARLTIVTDKKSKVISIPLFSIVDTKENSSVLKKVGDKFVLSPVSLGLKSGDGYVEILSGLQEGDVIDITPPATLTSCANGCAK